MGIGDALLARFKQAVALHVAALPSGTPAALSPVLDALALLSPHAEAVPLLESLLAWRLAAVRDATSGAADASRKRVAEVDAAFWEAVSRLVASDEGPAPPPAHVSEALEALAFDVLLSLASDTAAIDRVCRVLGQLSRRRVPALTNRLATELDGRIKLDASSAREQVASLCRGLTRVRLSLDSESDLRDAISFVRTAAPLRWTPSKKKGEWHHALCSLLTSTLSPLVGGSDSIVDATGAAAGEWKETLSGVRADILSWVAKSERKHLFAGIPLVTVLICLEARHEPGAPQLRAFLEGQVARCLKDKERSNRVAGMESVATALRFVVGGQQRFTDTGSGSPQQQLLVTLLSLLGSVPAALRRGGSSSGRAEESIVSDGSCTMLATIAASAMQLAPAMVLETLLPDVILPRGGDQALNELATCGLRALLACVTAANESGLSASPHSPLDGLSVALRRMRSGQSALGTAFPPQLRSSLASVAAAAAVAATAGAIPDSVSGGAEAQYACCVAMLQLVPFALPDDWSAPEKLVSALTALALAHDAAVSDAAKAAIHRVMACGPRVVAPAAPSIRSAIVTTALEAALRADPDGGHERAAAAVQLADAMVSDWMALLDSDVGGGGPAEAPGFLDGAAAEAASFFTLAVSTEPAVRRAALRMLETLHEAHDAGMCVPGQEALPLVPLIHGAAPDALAAAASAAQTWPAHRRGRMPRDSAQESDSLHAVLERTTQASQAARWALFIGSVSASASRDRNCRATAAAVHLAAARRLSALTPSLCGAHAESSPTLDVWRICACLAASTVSAARLDAPTLRDLARLLLAPLAAASAPQAAVQASFVALTCVSADLVTPLCAEAANLRDEATSSRTPKRRAHELRAAAATTLAALAASGRLGPGVRLSDIISAAVVSLAEDATNNVTTAAGSNALGAPQSGSGSAQAQQLADWPTSDEIARQRYALASCASCCTSAMWPPALRSRLFALCSDWALGDVLDAERAALVVRLPVRLSAAERSALDGDIAEANEAVSIRAADAAAALAPALGSEEALRWAFSALQRGVDRPGLSAAARRCLLSLARSKEECLAHLLAFSSKGASHLEWGPCFAAFTEGYTTHVARMSASQRANQAAPKESVVPEPHVVLAAALLRLCHADGAVRRDAAALAGAVRMRLASSFVGDSNPWPLVDDTVPPPPSVLPEVYLPPVVTLSARFAAAAPQLAIPLCCQVIRAALERVSLLADATAANGALAALLPWIDTLHLDDEAAVQEAAPLLRALYDLAELAGREDFAAASEALWGALALVSRGSAAAAVSFLLDAATESAAPRAGEPSLAFVACAKRCALYLVRVGPAATLEALVSSLQARRCSADGVAVALLASVTSEAPAEMTLHMPALLHAAVLAVATEQAEPTVVATHGRKLLGHLIARMAPASGIDDAVLVRRLTAAASAGRWSAVVGDTLALARGDSHQLRSAWASQALAWCADAPRSEDAECSVRVLAALACPLTQPVANALCDCVAACLSPARASRSPSSAIRFAVACLDALASSLAHTPPSKRVLYPCVFWAGVAALRVPASSSLNTTGAQLLNAFLGVDHTPGVTEDVLTMASPSVSGVNANAAPFPGLAPLALRVCSTSGGANMHAAAALLCRLATLPLGGAADVLYGDEDVRLPLACGAALPWLLSPHEGDEAAVRQEALSSVSWAATVQHGRSGTALAASLTAGDVSGTAWKLAQVLTPPAAAVTATALLVVLRNGPSQWHPAAISLLAAVLGPPANARPVPELSALLAAAVGPHADAARDALGVALKASSKPGVKVQQQASMLLSALLPEQDGEAAAAHITEALVATGVRRRDAPAFLFVE